MLTNNSFRCWITSHIGLSSLITGPLAARSWPDFMFTRLLAVVIISQLKPNEVSDGNSCMIHLRSSDISPNLVCKLMALIWRKVKICYILMTRTDFTKIKKLFILKWMEEGYAVFCGTWNGTDVIRFGSENSRKSCQHQMMQFQIPRWLKGHVWITSNVCEIFLIFVLDSF